MRLAISNIGWATAPDDPAVLALLRTHGVAGIDVAPTRLWPGWEGATVASARGWRRRLADAGFVVPAVQSLLYQRPDLTLFDGSAGREALIAHLAFVAELVAALGATTLVFGSPGIRAPGPDVDAFPVAVEAFGRIGARCAELGVCLCIEPNPPAYGCSFVTTAREGRALVAAVDSPGFGLHLDAAGCHLAGEDPAGAVRDSVGVLRHMHASEPQLGHFGAPVVDHAAVGAALRAGGYARWLSVELRPQELARIDEALRVVGGAYGPWESA